MSEFKEEIEGLCLVLKGKVDNFCVEVSFKGFVIQCRGVKSNLFPGVYGKI